MSRLTALLPVAHGAAIHAALKALTDHTANTNGGDPRNRGQIMADTLVSKILDQPTTCDNYGTPTTPTPTSNQGQPSSNNPTAGAEPADSVDPTEGAEPADSVDPTNSAEQTDGVDPTKGAEPADATPDEQGPANTDDENSDETPADRPAPAHPTSGNNDAAAEDDDEAEQEDQQQDDEQDLLADIDDGGDQPDQPGAPGEPDPPGAPTEPDPPGAAPTGRCTTCGGHPPPPRTPRRPGTPAIQLSVIMTDKALFGLDNEPAHIIGSGSIPAPLARALLAHHADTGTTIWTRRFYTNPTHTQLLTADHHQRLFPTTAAQFLITRDQTCRTPYCDAPIRHLDHIKNHTDGGPTNTTNGQGLCAACNLIKNTPGWTATTTPDGRRTTLTNNNPTTPTEPDTGTGTQNTGITITTPTGHTHHSTPPPPPRTHRQHIEIYWSAA